MAPFILHRDAVHLRRAIEHDRVELGQPLRDRVAVVAVTDRALRGFGDRGCSEPLNRVLGGIACRCINAWVRLGKSKEVAQYAIHLA